MNHCQHNCLGHKGNHGGCCTIDDRDWIMGPIKDADVFLKRVREKYPNTVIEWKDIFIDYEEGSKLFPDKKNWQSKNNYPCLRILNVARLPCIFYNLQLRLCTVYDIRPDTCINFYCEYLLNIKKK